MFTILKDPNFWMLIFYVGVLVVVTIGVVSTMPRVRDLQAGTVPSHWDKRTWRQRL